MNGIFALEVLRWQKFRCLQVFAYRAIQIPSWNKIRFVNFTPSAFPTCYL